MPDKKKRGFDLDDILNDVFKEIFKMEEFTRKIMRDLQESMRWIRIEPEELSEFRSRGPIVWGYTITLGPDGKIRFREFGNVKSVYKKPIVQEAREPLYDVYEEKDHVIVVVELPGVSKDEIKVNATEDKLIVRTTGERKYYTEIDLPCKVRPESSKATYRNGILEVRLEKQEKKVREVEEGHEVKVE